MRTRDNNNLSLTALLSATFMGVLDTSIVNVASPSIQRKLPANFEQIQLIIAGYIVAYGVVLVIGGRLGDNYGRKRMFLIGLIGFISISLCCAIAPNAAFLIIARVLQGIAGSLMLPQVLSIIRVLFDGSARAKALGLYGATVGAASIAGQIVGGLLITLDLFDWGWRWVFIVNIPIGIIAGLLAVSALPESISDKPAKLDLVGSMLLAITIGTFMYPLVAAPHDGWSLGFTALILVATISIFLFLKWERHIENRLSTPLIPTQLFKAPAFRTGLLIALTYYGGNLGFYLVLAYLLQSGFHYSAFESALIYALLGVGFVISSLKSRSLVTRYGIRTMIAGSVITIVSFVLLCLQLKISLPIGYIIIPLFITGVGQGLIAVTLIGKVLEGVETDLAGLASGSMLTATQIANAGSIALTGGIFTILLGKYHVGYLGSFIGCLVWLGLLALITAWLLSHLDSVERKTIQKH